MSEGDFRQWDEVWGSGSSGYEQVFSRRAARYTRAFCQQCYFEDLWAELSVKASGKHGIELGSGRGTTSMYLADKGWQVTLVDMAPQGLALAAQNFAREGLPPPNFILSDARRTGLADNCCDCVYNIGLLEHFDDPQPVLAEALRLLRPGGLLFMVIVPAIPKSRRWLTNLLFSPWRLTPTWLKRLVKRMLGFPPPPAQQEFTRTDYPRQRYAQWLHELGAAEVRCIAYNPYHDPQIGPSLDRYWVTPWYRLHHRLKSLFAKPPLLFTADSLASCDLLVARKR